MEERGSPTELENCTDSRPGNTSVSVREKPLSPLDVPQAAGLPYCDTLCLPRPSELRHMSYTSGQRAVGQLRGCTVGTSHCCYLFHTRRHAASWPSRRGLECGRRMNLDQVTSRSEWEPLSIAMISAIRRGTLKSFGNTAAAISPLLPLVVPLLSPRHNAEGPARITRVLEMPVQRRPSEALPRQEARLGSRQRGG